MTPKSADGQAFVLEGASLDGPNGPLLSGIDWVVRDKAITALLGPAGTGKSLLLRSLSGRAIDGWKAGGRWLYRGMNLWTPNSSVIPSSAWAPQIPGARGRRGPRADAGPSLWRQALQSGASAVLLDEPDSGATPEDLVELTEQLRVQANRGAAVFVTHDLSFARSVADDVALICAGSMVASGDAKRFFEQPPNELAARFVRDGNCWPRRPEPPPLPSHFHWILPGKLAGMGRPGLLGEAAADLEAVAAAGVGLLVSLTEEPLSPATPLPQGVVGRHFPIPDMGVPAIGPTASLCRHIERSLAAGTPVAVHCHAGLGRTGTILAAVLVWLGEKPSGAIERIRACAPGYIQNRAQSDFVTRFAEAVAPSHRPQPSAQRTE